MDVSNIAKKLMRLALLALMLCTPAGAAIAAPVTGAIFTTDMNSNFVNGNIYETAEDVYLNGGPRPNAPCTAAGLPNGPYYFQVTDPSGKVLLSYDSVDSTNHPIVDISQRTVNVNDHLIENYSGIRSTGNGKCVLHGFPSNKTVELFPYLRTPNPGGEYKVWMTPVDDYACGSNLGQECNVGFFGFIPSKSKTDNFKVIDYDGNGIPDSEDACPDGIYPSIAPPCVVNNTVSITTTTPTIKAGDQLNPLTFTITLSAPAPSGGLTVYYSIGATDSLGNTVLNDGTAFEVLSGSVTIPAGQTTALVTAMTFATGTPGTTIDVTLALSGTSNPAYVDSTSSTATVTINEPPPML